MEDYKKYLQSLSKIEDHRYLQNGTIINKLTKLGYRTMTSVLEEEDFYRLKAQMESANSPKVLSKLFYSSYFTGDDEVLNALAMREKVNVIQQISTIIFMQIRRRNGFDISGYIDYEMSLRQANMGMSGATDWRSIFEGRKLLQPKPRDLSFYNWRTGEVYSNENDNYLVVSQPVYGMYFMHKGDHKIVPITTKLTPNSENVTRTVLSSNLYKYVVLYDHCVRKKK